MAHRAQESFNKKKQTNFNLVKYLSNIYWKKREELISKHSLTLVFICHTSLEFLSLRQVHDQAE
jgi:hypothetical protein